MESKTKLPDIDLLADLAMDEEASLDEFDTFVERNRDALNAALAVAYEDIKQGRVRPLTVEGIMAMGDKRRQRGLSSR